MPNRLARETSPYLRQHADNPVDWYPWGEEALRRAQEEDRPILLSVGYSACHWCHVMERESFEDAETARLMNELFVNIKVDREERPDVDAVYMQAVQAMTGQGGWPLTVFLTPQGKPFYGGTYFPPQDMHGRPSFTRVLHAVAEAYRTRRHEIDHAADQLVDFLRSLVPPSHSADPLTPDVLRQAAQGLSRTFDGQFGGFGQAPKFPQSMTLEFLLRYHHRTRDQVWWQMATLTLDRMALGGLYDQLGGGFHRYSTDPYWLVPHFEKMLYDNALLARLYLHAYQATRNPFYRRICEETLDYVVREMRDPQGGFYSTQDADSEGVEGKFYVWDHQEVLDLLGPKEGSVFCAFFGVTPEGNWEGRNILWVPRSPEGVCQEAGVTLEELRDILGRGRRTLLEARARRVPPARDDKVQVSWNGLMLAAFAEAGAVLERPGYLKVAEANAAFVLERLRRNGRLLHTFKDGVASVPGYLEDYAFYAAGLLALYQATFRRRWLDEAAALARDMLELFYEPQENAFYDTGKDQPSLVVRPRNLFDNATPSGAAVAADVLLHLALITGEARYRSLVGGLLRPMRDQFIAQPMAFGHWLAVLDTYLSEAREIAIVGAPDNPATRALLAVVHGRYLPAKVLAGYNPQHPAQAQGVALLEGREALHGAPTAYVCRDFVCQMPVTDPAALEAQLQ